MLIAIELVGLSIVSHEQIGPAVVRIVEQSDSQRFGAAIENSARCRDIFKGAIASIMKQPASRAAIRFWRAVGLVFAIETAKHVVLRRPFHIIANEKIEQAVAVIVEPQCRRAESFVLAQSTAVGHIDKRALAGISE